MSDERDALVKRIDDATIYFAGFMSEDAIQKLLVDCRAALTAQGSVGEPVADTIEQRMLTWRQRFVNTSGDQLALDDFMDKESIRDFIDFVCAHLSAQPVTGEGDLPTLAPTQNNSEFATWLDSQEFHELCMDYRGAKPSYLAQEAFERLQIYIARHCNPTPAAIGMDERK